MTPCNDNTDPHWEIIREIMLFTQDIQVIENLLKARLDRFQTAMEKLQGIHDTD